MCRLPHSVRQYNVIKHLKLKLALCKMVEVSQFLFFQFNFLRLTLQFRLPNLHKFVLHLYGLLLKLVHHNGRNLQLKNILILNISSLFFMGNVIFIDFYIHILQLYIKFFVNISIAKVVFLFLMKKFLSKLILSCALLSRL